MGLTQEVVSFVYKTRTRDIPPEVIRLAQGFILDGLGVTLAGSTEKGSRILQAYIRQSGGYTQGANQARVLVLRQDGSVVENTRQLQPGDEILVMPKIETKSIEIARGLTQILYQIAIAAKVALDL